MFGLNASLVTPMIIINNQNGFTFNQSLGQSFFQLNNNNNNNNNNKAE